MAEKSVKLRTDLEIRPEKNSGIIVKDPVTRRFYRFPAVQATVLERLTGLEDYDSIAADASREHGLEVTAEQIREFTLKLRELLLLDHPYCWTKIRDIETALSNLLQYACLFRQFLVHVAPLIVHSMGISP